LDFRTINSSTTSFTYAGDLMDTASGGESFDLDFDDNGNMTTGVSETFTYNWDNKLRSASALSGNIKYDPSGNRVRKDSVLAGDRRYIVDIVGGLPTTLMEMTDNTILKTYIYANGQPLCQHDGDYSAAKYFYIHDRLGSTRQIINTSGSVVRYYTYESFGEVLEEDGTLANYMMFTGQYYDAEIDQYYLRARQYDPHISRFTARDPVFGKFEEPLTLHRYLYCLNDPTNKIDPFGLWAYYLTVTSQGAAVGGYTTQLGLAWDNHGNVGIIAIAGIGVGSVFQTVGGSFGVTTAETIYDLAGPGASSGFSTLWTGGWEYVLGLDDNDEIRWRGIEVTLGVTLTPDFFVGAEVHGYRTETVIIDLTGGSEEYSEAFLDMVLECETIGQASLMLNYGSHFLY